jgi:dTDP-D-glucose 4,6-dehydratase
VYVSDTSRAARDFGWKPQVRVDDGLERLWDWAQSLQASRDTAEMRDAAAARLAAVSGAPSNLKLRPGLAPVRPSA